MSGLRSTWLLVVSAAAAALAVACGDTGPDRLSARERAEAASASDEEGTQQSQQTTQPATASAGKDYFATNIHPLLAQKCGACHDEGGLGNPTWIFKADAAKTYDLLYANGYVTPTGSRLVDKGVHHGGAAPALEDAEKTTVLAWISAEIAAGGSNVPSVLEKFGSCLDKQKFLEIGLETLVTTRRTKDNNTNNVQPWEEKANTCTGCDNTPCRACHSMDDATGFILALGNPNLPADITFEQTKLVSPPYLQKYFTAGPDGMPAASNGLVKKSDATRLDRAYTHPMYVIPPEMQSRIEAFVNDAIVRYAQKQCGQ